ncbi:hypothetical protein CYMTET_46364 [Cymbomonas tetramitiformis]|uniref:DUF659 domain-containing protein n=1 Tax=Cymbomonas tetramitiformis TaxID=36881 RepID=A0AAE0BXV5_9CHLO|nr:hypothetical protein CYMTET_46364 [Cymbomonas tetramitiformis]
MAKLILKFIAILEERRGKTADAVCTDNPTVMKEARSKVEIERPHMLFTSCVIHDVSKWIEDLCALPSVAVLTKHHDFIVTKIRNKQCLVHAELKRAHEFDDLRPLFTDEVVKESNRKTYKQFIHSTLIRRGATRMGTRTVTVMKHNVKLQPAMQKVISHPDYNKRCGIAQRRAGLASADQVREAFAYLRT